MKNNYILITGVGGFIGFHLANHLIKKNYNVVGIDNLNSYYDIKLKKNRIKILNNYPLKKFKFIKMDISKTRNFSKLEELSIGYVFHLAAQAGVRYSIEKPQKFIDSNITGYLNLIEFCNKKKIKKIFCASSSSVYGSNTNLPFSETHVTDNMIQFYAITKKTNEYMSKLYSKLLNISIICGRFFTVYGPMGRPDMAIYKFALKIKNKEIIEIYNHGRHFRDFTYIDDLVDILFKIMNRHLKIKSKNYFNVFNIASGKKGNIKKILKLLEINLQMKTKLSYVRRQEGDMIGTWGETKKLKKFIISLPRTSYTKGIKLFSNWFKEYYKIK